MSNYTLYHADCLEQMKSIPNNSIDMVLCDLPYRNDTEQVGYSYRLKHPLADLFKNLQADYANSSFCTVAI